jgi:hypothetical protein
MSTTTVAAEASVPPETAIPPLRRAEVIRALAFRPVKVNKSAGEHVGPFIAAFFETGCPGATHEGDDEAYRARCYEVALNLGTHQAEEDGFDVNDPAVRDSIRTKLDTISGQQEGAEAVTPFYDRTEEERNAALDEFDSAIPSVKLPRSRYRPPCLEIFGSPLFLRRIGHAPRRGANHRTRRASSGSRAGPDDGDGESDPPGVALRRPGGNTAETPAPFGSRR